jgi:hypothetical protein
MRRMKNNDQEHPASVVNIEDVGSTRFHKAEASEPMLVGLNLAFVRREITTMVRIQSVGALRQESFLPGTMVGAVVCNLCWTAPKDIPSANMRNNSARNT